MTSYVGGYRVSKLVQDRQFLSLSVYERNSVLLAIFDTREEAVEPIVRTCKVIFIRRDSCFAPCFARCKAINFAHIQCHKGDSLSWPKAPAMRFWPSCLVDPAKLYVLEIHCRRACPIRCLQGKESAAKCWICFVGQSVHRALKDRTILRGIFGGSRGGHTGVSWKVTSPNFFCIYVGHRLNV